MYWCPSLFALKLEVTASDCVKRAPLVEHLQDHLQVSQEKLERSIVIFEAEGQIRVNYVRGVHQDKTSFEVKEDICVNLPRYVRIWIERIEEDIQDFHTLETAHEIELPHAKDDQNHSHETAVLQRRANASVAGIDDDNRPNTREEILTSNQNGDYICGEDCILKPRQLGIFIDGLYDTSLSSLSYGIGLDYRLFNRRTHAHRFSYLGIGAGYRQSQKVSIQPGTALARYIYLLGDWGLQYVSAKSSFLFGVRQRLGGLSVQGEGFTFNRNPQLIHLETDGVLGFGFGRHILFECGVTVPWHRSIYRSLTTSQRAAVLTPFVRLRIGL